MSTPRPKQTNISTGTHWGLCLTVLGVGGVYRDGFAV
jgi:hypothetical protein